MRPLNPMKGQADGILMNHSGCLAGIQGAISSIMRSRRHIRFWPGGPGRGSHTGACC